MSPTWTRSPTRPRGTWISPAYETAFPYADPGIPKLFHDRAPPTGQRSSHADGTRTASWPAPSPTDPRNRSSTPADDGGSR